MTEFVQLLQAFGLPVALLAIVGLAIWRIILWLKPWAERAIQGHIDLLDATTKSLEKISDLHEQQAASMGQLAQEQKEIRTSVERISIEGCRWGRANKGGEP